MSGSTMDGFALITGGGGGIGKECALALAEAGVEGILIADLNEEAAKKAADECKTFATNKAFKTAVFQFDVRNADQVQSMVDYHVQTFGRLDYAVNAAGIDDGKYAPFDETKPEDFDRIHEINTKGFMLCLAAEIRTMKKQDVRKITHHRTKNTREVGRGTIVNMVSATGVACRPGDTLYTTSKHAEMALTKMAALDHAKDGVRINAVCPTWVRSPMVDRLTETNPQVMGMINAIVPWKRMAEPEEVADSVVFLCSPASSYMNGSHLLLDCGATLQLRITH